MTAKAKLDQKKYAKLLGKALPTVPQSEADYQQLMEAFDELFDKEDLSPEEDALYELLITLIEKYEDEPPAFCYSFAKILQADHSALIEKDFYVRPLFAA